MTADTAYGVGTTALDSSQQLVDYSLPMGVGDDDGWFNVFSYSPLTVVLCHAGN